MKNDAALSKGKSGVSMTPKNTSLHKLRAMGQHPKFEARGGKKTPA